MRSSRLQPTTSIAQKSRTLAAEQRQVWDVVGDPHQISRWWPRVASVEGVRDQGWTQVQAGKHGRPVRVDFRLVQSDPPWHRAWEQELAGTPFERVLNESLTEISLEPVPEGTLVTIAQRQQLRGYSRTAGLIWQRATGKELSRALEGLERILSPRDGGFPVR